MIYEEFNPGTIIIKEGSPPDNFYFIVDGSVNIYKKRT
jgi:hypothetical protein